MSVTIGIPFYNAEQTLADAIRSVFAQTFEDWEMLLVDDGSRDQSIDIARAVRDPRVKVFSDGANLGLHARLNQIAHLANQRFLARMDSDDLMHPTRLERQLLYLKSNDQLDVIGSGVYVIDGANHPCGSRDNDPLDSRPIRIMQQPILPHPTITGKTKWFQANPYDESFSRAEDFELWCRTCSKSQFEKIAQPLYYFREGARDPRRYLSDYLDTARTVRKVLNIYGPETVGKSVTVKLVAASYMKQIMYLASTALGIQHKVLKMRKCIPLDDHESAAATAGLEIISHTHVPGLDA